MWWIQTCARCCVWAGGCWRSIPDLASPWSFTPPWCPFEHNLLGSYQHTLFGSTLLGIFPLALTCLDSWMDPYQRTPMGNPYLSPISRGYLWVKKSPRIPRDTIYTMGAPNCPLIPMEFGGLLMIQNGWVEIPLKKPSPKKSPRKEITHGIHIYIYIHISWCQLWGMYCQKSRKHVLPVLY